MKVYILEVRTMESYTNVVVAFDSFVYSTRELAEEHIRLSPSWDELYNEEILFSIKELNVLEFIDIESILQQKEDFETLRQKRDDYELSSTPCEYCDNPIMRCTCSDDE
jgi:hypothetical protein